MGKLSNALVVRELTQHITIGANHLFHGCIYVRSSGSKQLLAYFFLHL